MQNILIIFILAAMLVLAVRFLYRARKKGNPCSGCPYGGSCSGHCTKKEK